MIRPVIFLCTFLTLGLAACGDKTGASATDAGTTIDAGTTTAVGMSTTTLPTTTVDPSNGGDTTTTTDVPGTTAVESTLIVDESSTSSSEGGDDGTSECMELPLPETTTDPSTTDPSTGDPCQDPLDQPQSADCSDTSGCGCASGKCFLVPILGGFCGECLDDDDCPGGCTIPNPILGVGATCNLGGQGAGCNEDATCLNTCASKCGVVLSVPGIIEVKTCGGCNTNADCTNPQKPNCTPEYDVPNFAGLLACRPNGSVPNDEGCSLTDDGMGEPVGDAVCESGKCGEAVVMGLLKLGVCGECNSNADCPNGQTCSDPFVDLMQGDLNGATCM